MTIVAGLMPGEIVLAITLRNETFFPIPNLVSMLLNSHLDLSDIKHLITNRFAT